MYSNFKSMITHLCILILPYFGPSMYSYFNPILSPSYIYVFLFQLHHPSMYFYLNPIITRLHLCILIITHLRILI